MAQDAKNGAVTTPKPQPAATATGKQKWSLKKKLVVIGGIFVGIIIVLVILVSVATSAPVKVSNDFISDMQTNNPNAGYGLMSKDAQGATSQADFTTAINRVSPILNGKSKMISKEVKGETGSAATAKVVYEIKGSDNITYTLTINLTKENGQWKVLNFESVKK